MAKASIAIDPWKLPIFDRHLTQSGYKFENSGLLHKDALLLRVVLKAANTEAALTGKPT